MVPLKKITNKNYTYIYLQGIVTRLLFEDWATEEPGRKVIN